MTEINQYDINNKQTGYWEVYWYNGQLSHIGNYLNGKLNGYWVRYYSNGEIWCKEFYI